MFAFGELNQSDQFKLAEDALAEDEKPQVIKSFGQDSWKPKAGLHPVPESQSPKAAPPSDKGPQSDPANSSVGAKKADAPKSDPPKSGAPKAD